ncbi:MAG: fumarate hydratase C-terminal domain-containing protein, partial [Candidatus Syntrophosphaera sp.]|nr:fumarate hydratase C-terminal domain-containing protein [Candidatus Syntrophosphaera sp.]
MKTIKINLPFQPQQKKELKVRDKILLSGELYTARDQAHIRLTQLIKEGKPLPFDLSNSALFYCGPAPIPPGKV